MERPIRLAIELVPSTCWYSNVRSNVRPGTWDHLQRLAFQEAGFVCQICGGKGPRHPVEAHEVWAYDDNVRIQKLDHIESLCPACHEVKHFGLAMESGHAKGALAHLIAVNEISPAEATAYVQRAFLIQKIRSRFQWTLDVSLLTRKYGIRLDVRGIEQGFDLP